MKYDLNTLHDPDKDYNGISPYRSPSFPSIYKGLTMEIHVVDHCNLNCAGCNHFSPIAKPWYITEEEFTNQLILLKNNIPTVKELLILGGEPLLHPNFINLCKIARSIFSNPEILIRVLSNGVNINLSDEDIQVLFENDILLNFCNYPGYTDIEKISKINAPYFATRSVIHQVLVDETGSQNKEFNFYNCNKFRLPCLTIRDSKIFLCPFIAHLHHYANKINMHYELVENVDYLNVESINNNLDLLQDFCFSPKEACKYCIQDTYEWIWHKSHKDIVEYKTPLNDLYYTDYDRYYNIINKHFDYLLKCYDPSNPKEVDAVYGVDFNDKIFKRLGHGAIDIIIPHYNLSKTDAINLINTLQSQSFIEYCVIYFISDNSPTEKDLIDLVVKSNLNYVLLKTKTRQGPGAARNLGLAHSFNKYKFFLDADDYFCNNNALEILYGMAIESSYDLVEFLMYSQDQSGNKSNFLIAQSLLRDNNIIYNNLYFGEDLVFQAAIKSQAKNHYSFNNNENLFAVYNKNNVNSLTTEVLPQDPNHLNYITSKLLSSTYDIDFNFFHDYIYNSLCLLERQEKILFTNDFNKVFIYWIYYQLYQLCPDYYKIVGINDSKLIDFQNNKFYITLSDQIIQNEKDGYKYIVKYIKQHCLNNFMTASASYYILHFYENLT